MHIYTVVNQFIFYKEIRKSIFYNDQRSIKKTCKTQTIANTLKSSVVSSYFQPKITGENVWIWRNVYGKDVLDKCITKSYGFEFQYNEVFC